MKRAVAGLLLCALVAAGTAGAVTAPAGTTTEQAIAADASSAATVNATVDAESLELHNDAGQTVAGTVDAEDGASVEVYLRVPAKLVVRSYATAEDGRFAMTFDLSDLEPGTTIDGKVSVDGEAATEFQIEVVEGDGDGGPSGSTDGGSTDDSDNTSSDSTDDGSTGGADNTSTADGSTTENESSTDQNSTDDETTDDAQSSTDETSENRSSSEKTSQNASDETEPSMNETEGRTQNEDQSSADSLPGFGVLPALFGLLGARRLIDR